MKTETITLTTPAALSAALHSGEEVMALTAIGEKEVLFKRHSAIMYTDGDGEWEVSASHILWHLENSELTVERVVEKEVLVILYQWEDSTEVTPASQERNPLLSVEEQVEQWGDVFDDWEHPPKVHGYSVVNVKLDKGEA